MKAFIEKHKSKITATLECFDRIIFKGYLPFSYPQAMQQFMDYNGILIKDFKPFVLKQAQKLKSHAKNIAARDKRPFIYLNGRARKEKLVKEIVRKDKITRGLVCILSTVEPCSSFRLVYGVGRPQLQKANRKCLFLYYYFVDREFGLMHVRIQTWFPFQIQVYINGHEWLAHKMDRLNIKYTQLDNAFTAIQEPQRVQRLANNFIKQKWPRVLSAFARRVNPLLKNILKNAEYYWVIDQAEFATDVMFKSRTTLKSLYEKLLRHATMCFSAEDVLAFLGRKLHGRFEGEVLNEFKRRWPGARIKHRMKENWIKMYDKHGCVLRIETVINRPCEFKVYRSGIRDGQEVIGWFPMAKGVANFYRYLEVSRTANNRYLQALSIVEDPANAYHMLGQLCEPVQCGNRRRRGFNPLRKDDYALFTTVLRGEYFIKGFRNRDITQHLFGRQPKDPIERRKRSARVTRLIQLLRAHGLIAKIPRARRYRPTLRGIAIMSAVIQVREEKIPVSIHKMAS
jgi:hypothetical protein